jgi:hypothetical protein
LGGCDIQPAGRVNGHDQARLQGHLASQQEALELTSAEQSRGGVGSGAADSEPLYQRLRKTYRPLDIEQRTECERRSIVGLENRVIRQRKIADQAFTQTVLRNVADAAVGELTWTEACDITLIQHDASANRSSQPGHHLSQLALPVTRHARNAENLADGDVEAHIS